MHRAVLLLLLALAQSEAFLQASGGTLAGLGSPQRRVCSTGCIGLRLRRARGLGLRMARRGTVAEPSVDYYQVLGVGRDANAAEIKLAYRQLASVYHPDVNPAEDAKETFIVISQAFEVLGDASNRRTYDYRLQTGLAEDFSERVDIFRQNAPPGYNKVADFFEYMFSDSKMVIVLYMIPTVSLLLVTTFFPDVLKNIVDGAARVK